MGLLRGSNERVFCAHTNFKDNIGNKDLERGLMAHEPIDIVYTWVNGSDPVWLAKKLKFTARSLQSESESEVVGDGGNVSVTEQGILASGTLNASNTYAAANMSAVEPVEIDEASSDNRYRDSNELRYSLRSLVKYAPWIRNIYIVTDNQIPHWLNLENERLFMVSHSEMFPNISHLPVFSSPAIEAHLHRIPGLSKRFIYFNDDVFLGAPVTPEDFVSISGVQKFTMAWDVPKCAPGCAESWIGDGYCDKACNVSACDFDFPDCLPKNESAKVAMGARGNRGAVGMTLHCSPGCPDSWLSDKVCDTKCNKPECGFDLGDCGVAPLLANFPGAALGSPLFTPALRSPAVSVAYADLRVSNLTANATLNLTAPSSALRPVFSARAPIGNAEGVNSTSTGTNSTVILPPVVLAVPYGSTFAVHFNISLLAYLSGNAEGLLKEVGGKGAIPGVYNATGKNLSTIMRDGDFVYSSAEYDNERAVHVANVLTKHHLLAVILYRHYYPENSGNSHEVVLEPPERYPEDTTFTVRGFNSVTNVSVVAEFVLRITPPVADDSESWITPERWLRAMPIVPALPAPADGGAITDPGHEETPIGLTFPPVSGFIAQCNNFNAQDSSLIAQVRLMHKPFRIMSDAGVNVESNYKYDVDSGVVLLVETASPEDPEADGSHISSLLHIPADALELRVVFTLANGTVIEAVRRLAETLGAINREGLVVPLPFAPADAGAREASLAGRIDATRAFHAAYSGADFYKEPNGSYCSPSSRLAVAALADLVLQSPKHEAPNPHNALLLRVSVPLHPAETPVNSWVHIQWEIAHASGPVSTSAALSANSDTEQGAEEAGSAPSISGCGVVSFKWGTFNRTAVALARARRQQERVAAAEAATTAAISESNSTDSNASLINWTELVGESSLRRRLSDTATAPARASRRQPYVSSALLQWITDRSKPIRQTAASSPVAWVLGVVRSWNRQGGHGHTVDATSEGRDSIGGFDHAREVDKERQRKLAKSMDDWLRWLQETEEEKEKEKTAMTAIVGGRRRLLGDTYAQSLIHVNRMYNRAFGTENRKVPAHVPHMVNRDIMEELQARWPEQWAATSTHRFRSPVDMQYSFAYYHYVMNRHKLK